MPAEHLSLWVLNDGCHLLRISVISDGKEYACNAGDLGSIPGLGRSPREEKAYPLQYSRLENSMDCIVHGVTKSQTQLSDFHFSLSQIQEVGFQLNVRINIS